MTLIPSQFGTSSRRVIGRRLTTWAPFLGACIPHHLPTRGRQPRPRPVSRRPLQQLRTFRQTEDLDNAAPVVSHFLVRPLRRLPSCRHRSSQRLPEPLSGVLAIPPWMAAYEVPVTKRAAPEVTAGATPRATHIVRGGAQCMARALNAQAATRVVRYPRGLDRSDQLTDRLPTSGNWLRRCSSVISCIGGYKRAD